MISLAASPTIRTWPLVELLELNTSAIYEMANAIFRLIAMIFQYSVVKTVATVRHLCCFPSALRIKNLKVSSCNVANLAMLCHCLSTAWRPQSKEAYQKIGIAQGFRITHPLILRPASGLCLGKSLTFLSTYLLRKGETIADLIAAAQAVEEDANETSIKVQAIYDALMGIQGKIPLKERRFFSQVLQGLSFSPQETLNQELLASIQTFLSLKTSSQTLRQFVLDHLEDQGIEIDPNLYALILELDTVWSLQYYPEGKRYGRVYRAINNTVAQYLHMNITHSTSMGGEISTVREKLEALEEGCHLIQFSNHTIAYVKTQDLLAVFDPNEGLAIFDNNRDRQEGLSQLLEYYGNNDFISFNLHLKLVMRPHIDQ